MFDFGANLRALRKNKKLTQQRLADKLGLSEAMISKYESNLAFPQFEKLRELSSILNVSLDELCGMQSQGSVSLHGLSDEQIEIIEQLIYTFRNEENQIKHYLSQNQCVLLGKITEQFLKQ